MKANFTILALLFFSSLLCQTQKISGTVSDSNAPLPGANVLVKGTSFGTQTDFDGNFEIQARKGDILLVTYVGFKTEAVAITNISKHLNIILQEDSQALDEVVVMGYASQPRRAFTSAVTMVNGLQISKVDISRHLQGKVAGVNITGTGQNLTKEQKLLIENATESNEKNSDVLYIVDGQPIPQANNGIIENIHPNDILKKHIYTKARARNTFGITNPNGCIVIETKSGDFKVENDENYARINENRFEQAVLSPLSTFSIDVDNASYSNVRRMINNGQVVIPGAVKIEELINYFNYDYAQPKGQHPFSIHTDVVTTPWNNSTKLVRVGLQGKKYEKKPIAPFKPYIFD